VSQVLPISQKYSVQTGNGRSETARDINKKIPSMKEPGRPGICARPSVESQKRSPEDIFMK